MIGFCRREYVLVFQVTGGIQQFSAMNLLENCLHYAAETHGVSYDVQWCYRTSSFMVVLQHFLAGSQLVFAGGFVGGPEGSIRQVADFGHVDVYSVALRD